MSSQPPPKATTSSGSKPQGKPAQSKPPGSSSKPVSSTSAPAKTPQGSVSTKPRTGPPPQRPRKRPVQPPPKRGLRNSDLAFIFVGLVLVGALIWAGLQAANSNNTTNAAANPPAASNTGANPNATTAAAPASGDDTPLGGKGSPNYGKSPADFTPIAEGETAPDFTLPDPNGTNYSLSQFKGKTVLLEFFATWCPHCQNDAPMMNQLDAAYKDKNVQVLGVNASPYGHNYENKDPSAVTKDDIVWFRDTFTVTFPLLMDPNVGTAVWYGVSGYPTVYIVDKDGKVAMRPKYPFKYEDLAADLDEVLMK